MSDDTKSLQSYGTIHGYCIHCVDSNPSMGFAEFEDVSKVEKYVMKDADYAKRDDTFAKFRKQQLKMNPNFKSHIEQLAINHQEEEAKAIEVGQRCETNIGAKRGVVKYVGKVASFERGYWVGIQLDEPTGDTNGQVKDEVYFACPD